MSDNCPNSMVENKKEKTKKEGRKDKESDPHFVKVIDYAKKEPWRTDILLGQKGDKSHIHATLSGSGLYYLEDEKGEAIIENGNSIICLILALSRYLDK